MLWGLLLGNLIDLDHIYLRIIGKVEWFESACVEGLGSQCSFGIYPLHNIYTAGIFFILGLGSFFYNRKHNTDITKWIFWISIGVLIALGLDYLHLITGVGF